MERTFFVLKVDGEFHILDEVLKGESLLVVFEGPLDACERYVAFADVEESKPEAPKPDGIPF